MNRGTVNGGTASTSDLHRWSESLAALARTGLGFTRSLYEKERFEEVLRIAADIKAAAHPDAMSHSDAGPPVDIETAVDEWIGSVGSGVAGYVTPKLAIGAAVGNDKGELLLIQRADSGFWLYPTGWADVGYSASEVVVKEVQEETGIDVEPIRLLAVFDSMRSGFSRFSFYSLVFQCRPVGGELAAHPLECSGIGWFGRDNLPSPLAGGERWVDHLFNAIAPRPDREVQVLFDPPRRPPWRGSAEL